MSFQRLIMSVFSYLPVRSQSDADKKELKRIIEVELVKEIKNIYPEYKITGHTQQGKWADVPWVGIHDPNVDSSPQTGIYVAILFNIQGDGFAISIQHGTEHMGLKEILNSVEKVSRVMRNKGRFSSKPLSIRPANWDIRNNARPGKYEIANVLGRQYSSYEVSEEIENDLTDLIDIYKKWVNEIVLADNEDVYQEHFGADLAIETNDYHPPERNERKNIKLGSKYPPRSLQEGQKALENAGFKCEVNSEHKTFFTGDGNMYMEKHHLIPMEQYYNFDKSIDHYSNIYALCPNCHKMIHIAQLQERRRLIEFLFSKREDILVSVYGVNLKKILSYYKIT